MKDRPYPKASIEQLIANHNNENAQVRRDYAEYRQTLQETFDGQETRIANLEKQNRKLNDKLNRFRNLTPGRKRLHDLGRLGAALEYEADELVLDRERRFDESSEAVLAVRTVAVNALRVDAIFLHRLQWDFEQLREVVYPSKQPAHEWKRP